MVTPLGVASEVPFRAKVKPPAEPVVIISVSF